MKRRRGWTSTVVGVLLVAGAVWGLLSLTDEEDGVPEAFTVSGMVAAMDEPGGMDRQFKSDAYERLTDEQRKQVWKNKEEAFYAHFMSRVDAYFAADEAEREAMLDRHLDELEAAGKAKGESAAGKSGDGKSDGKATGKSSGEGKGSGGGKGKGGMTREQRQAKSESANPDEMARILAYKEALDRRAGVRRGTEGRGD